MHQCCTIGITEGGKKKRERERENLRKYLKRRAENFPQCEREKLPKSKKCRESQAG